MANPRPALPLLTWKILSNKPSIGGFVRHGWGFQQTLGRDFADRLSRKSYPTRTPPTLGRIVGNVASRTAGLIVTDWHFFARFPVKRKRLDDDWCDDISPLGPIGLLIESVVWHGMRIDDNLRIWQRKEEPISIMKAPYQNLKPFILKAAVRSRNSREVCNATFSSDCESVRNILCTMDTNPPITGRKAFS